VRALTAAAATLLLGACAAPTGKAIVADAKAMLDAEPLCCQSLATARRAPLPLVPTKVPIGKGSPAFDFGGNKAYFVLYELPAYRQPYSIYLSSNSSGRLDDMALFVPRVALYDEDFKVTRFFDERSLRQRGDNLERTVFVNPANRGERFIAIYGSDLSSTLVRDYSAVVVTTMSAGLATFNMVSGRDGKSTLRSAPAGELTLEVSGLTPASR
jgi:hypothetical protein